MRQEQEIRRRVAASTFARRCLNGIVKDVFTRLSDQGRFRDPVQDEIEQELLPWLNANALSHIENLNAAKQTVYTVVATAMAQNRRVRDAELSQHKAAVQRKREEEKRIKEAEIRFLEELQTKASRLLQRTDPELVSPDLVNQTRDALVSAREIQTDDADQVAIPHS